METQKVKSSMAQETVKTHTVHKDHREEKKKKKGNLSIVGEEGRYLLGNYT